MYFDIQPNTISGKTLCHAKLEINLIQNIPILSLYVWIADKQTRFEVKVKHLIIIIINASYTKKCKVF